MVILFRVTIVHDQLLVSCRVSDTRAGHSGGGPETGNSFPNLPRQQAASRRPSDTCRSELQHAAHIAYSTVSQSGAERQKQPLPRSAPDLALSPCLIADLLPLGAFADTPRYLQAAGSRDVAFPPWYRSCPIRSYCRPFDVMDRPRCHRPGNLMRDLSVAQHGYIILKAQPMLDMYRVCPMARPERNARSPGSVMICSC